MTQQIRSASQHTGFCPCNGQRLSDAIPPHQSGLLGGQSLCSHLFLSVIWIPSFFLVASGPYYYHYTLANPFLQIRYSALSLSLRCWNGSMGVRAIDVHQVH